MAAPYAVRGCSGLSAILTEGVTCLWGLSDWSVFPAQGLADFVSRAEMALILGLNCVSSFGSFYLFDSNFGTRVNIFGVF